MPLEHELRTLCVSSSPIKTLGTVRKSVVLVASLTVRLVGGQEIFNKHILNSVQDFHRESEKRSSNLNVRVFLSCYYLCSSSLDGLKAFK